MPPHDRSAGQTRTFVGVKTRRLAAASRADSTMDRATALLPARLQHPPAGPAGAAWDPPQRSGRQRAVTRESAKNCENANGYGRALLKLRIRECPLPNWTCGAGSAHPRTCSATARLRNADRSGLVKLPCSTTSAMFMSSANEFCPPSPHDSPGWRRHLPFTPRFACRHRRG